MAAGKDLEIALRLKADLKQGQAALEQLGDAVTKTGDDAAKAEVQLNHLGETVDQAKTRIQAIVAATLQQKAAQQEYVSTTSRSAEATRSATASVDASTAAHNASAASQASAERAARSRAASEQTATEETVKATAETRQQAAELAKLLGTLDGAERGLARLDTTEQALNKAYREGRLELDTYRSALEKVEQQRNELNSKTPEARAAAKAAAETRAQKVELDRLLGSVDSTTRALNRLNTTEEGLTKAYREGRLELGAYNSALEKIRSQRDALTNVGNEAKSSTAAVSTLGTSIRKVQQLLAVGFAGYGLTSASQAIVNTNLQWQQAQYTMEAATGSAAKARQELEYVREVSERLGLELLSTSQSYARLVAAAKETPALGKSLHSIFEGVTAAATTLHLTKSETDSVLLALEQMVSKGKVQTQELVLQLGQRVPGAFALAAKALGTNTEQLSKWLEKGMIPAAEFLPRFGAALEEAYGSSAQQAAKGLNSELNRLSNAFTELKIEAGEAGFIDSYTNAIRELQTILKDPAVKDGLNTLIKSLGKLIEFGVKGAASTVGVIKFAAEEISSRVNGPAGDDPIRIQESIDRETKFMDDAQKRLDAAWEKNDTKAAERIQLSMSNTQELIAQWQQMLDSNKVASKPVELPATTVTAPSTPFKPTDDGKAAAKLAKQNEDWVKQLEKEASTYGKGKAALREYELEQRNLTGSLAARAKAAWATLDAAEKQKKADAQAAKDLKTLAQLQVDYLKSSGRSVDAAGAEIEKKYGALQKRLLAAGNVDGAGLVDKLMNIDKAKAELDQLEQQIERVFGEQSRREQTINTQQQAGLISEVGARQQILDLNKLTADQVEKLVPKMQELAQATGDPAAIERVKDLQARLGNLRVVANELSNALKAGFETGIQSALEGLATGTMDLKDAALSFVRDIASSLASVASQKLAKMATDSLSNLFSSGAEVATDTAGAAATASAITGATSAGAAAMGTGITAGGTTAAATMGTAISTAGASAASAMATAIATASAAGSAGSATSSALSVGASAAVAAATGGHITGPGTGTSDSIAAWLSDNEFVTRAAVVTQPGALHFLHDFNSRGMAALDDYAKAVRHSTGGLAGTPAPAMPRPSIGSGRLAEPAKAMSATLKNSQNFYLVDDPSRITDTVYNTPQGTEAMVVALSRDPARFRSVLGLRD